MKVFVDFDDVIFNTGKFKTDLKELFLAEGIDGEMFDKHYYDPKDTRRLKMFDPILHALRIETETGISMQELMIKIGIFLKDVSKYVFEDVGDFLKFVGKKNVYLISYGDEKFVKLKVTGSGIMRNIAGVRVADGRKSDVIKKIILAENFSANEKIFFLDDRSEQIADVKKEIPKVFTIIVKRPEGRYDDPKETFCDFEAKDFREAQEIIKKITGL